MHEKDENVKAFVLRVNSPGGSITSETILREMILAKAEKPIAVSMGDVAASGGYYIACHADTIVANSTTITGSTRSIWFTNEYSKINEK